MRRYSIVLCCLAIVLSGCQFYLPIADFSPSVRAGDLPLEVTFTDLSKDGGQPITNWRWDFGDGTTSTAMNPVHTYTERGTYTVSLIVETPWGMSERVVEDLIEVRQVVRFPDAKLDATLRAALGIPTASIRVADLETLTTLDGAEAGISNLAGLEFAVNLETLLLESNDLTDIAEIGSLRKLRTLNLRDNAITDISPLAALREVELIDLGINQVTYITPLRDLEQLTELNLERNPDLADILPLRFRTGLRELSLAFTALTQVDGDPEGDDLGPLGLLTNLVFLDLAANEIRDLGAISELVNLETLILFDCQIEDISPLADLVSLRELQLSANGIADVSVLSDFESIQLLTLQMNQIQDIAPLVANPGLGFNDVVRLTGNPLNPDALCSGIPTLEARGVIVEVDQTCVAP
jgi:internalin A